MYIVNCFTHKKNVTHASKKFCLTHKNDVKSRVRRSNFVEDQFDILEGVGDHLTNTFAINGKHCIQRLICEISEVPVNKLSFMGKILHELIV